MGKQMSSAKPKAETYTKKELGGYLVGLAGQNIIYNVIATGLAFYLQNVIFIPVLACSVIFAIARVWDAINDPMMGSIVDRTRTKHGKCVPYLRYVPPIVCVSTILCFTNKMYDINAPMWERVLIIAWAGIAYVMWGMTYTAGDIPLWGVTSLMTEDQDDRAKVLALARIVASVGVIGMLITFVSPSLVGPLKAKGYDDAHALQYAYIIVAIILSIVGCAMFQVAGLSVKERVHQDNEHHSMKDNFKTIWTCRPFRQLTISAILRSPLQLLSLVAMQLVMYYYFNNNIPGTLNPNGKLDVSLLIKLLILIIGVFGGGLISSVTTPKLAQKIEKKKLYNFYSLFGAIPFASLFVVYLLAKGNLSSLPTTVLVGAIFFMTSWAMGGINVLQSIMIADCVDYEEYNTGIRPDGVFFSGQTFTTKLSAGISIIISGVVYKAVQFTDNNIKILNAELLKGADFKTYADGKYAMAMFLLVSIPPAIGLILSAIPTLKYALSDKEHTRILDALNAKRNEGKEIIKEDIEAK